MYEWHRSRGIEVRIAGAGGTRMMRITCAGALLIRTSLPPLPLSSVAPLPAISDGHAAVVCINPCAARSQARRTSSDVIRRAPD